MEPIHRSDLVHTGMSMQLEDFMKRIDETGGWPVGYNYVSFFHSLEDNGRVCQFTMTCLNTGWWTTVCSADDYYYWKLSPKKINQIMAEARWQIIKQLR